MSGIDSYNTEPYNLAQLIQEAEDKDYLAMVDAGNYTQDTTDLYDDIKQDRVCIPSNNDIVD
jgi:hypothetical protein